MNQRSQAYSGGSVPETYEQFLVPILFSGYADDIVEALEFGDDCAVLETACGTGAVTRRLAVQLPDGCRMTVTDLAPAMVELARQNAGADGDIEYMQADATDLPFGDRSFDSVICQFSLMLFPDKVQAMREAARVLKPGGHFVFNVWDDIDRNGFSKTVHDAMAALYPNDPPRFLAKPYSYHDPAAVRRDLKTAGFGDVVCESRSRSSRARDARDVAIGLVAGSPLAGEAAERGPLEDAIDAAEALLRERYGSGSIEAPMRAHQFEARTTVSV